MRTILVTGGAGFIGSCFVRQSLASGDVAVITLDSLTYASSTESLASVLDHPRHTFVRADVRERHVVEALLKERVPSAIVNFAAETHVDRSIDAPGRFLEANAVATQCLLDTAHSYWRQLPASQQSEFRFVQVSTDEVFGSLGTDGKFTERSPYAPNSPYAASKAAADHMARAYFRTFGLPTVVTYCGNNFGPYQFPEKLIPLATLNALGGRAIPVYGDGSQVRDWIHVSDHCRALWSVLTRGRPGEAYAIGAECERTNLQVVQSICSAVDRLCESAAHAPSASLIQFVQDRPGHDRRYALDASKIRTELGWRPVADFEHELAETVRWYLENRDWAERITAGKYGGERLGLPR
ncbi:MAG: dTDP-glucose 4,6-dehydratase [Planctomycetes bacterium]|nr:dTDP-glucose 4,6-dehydratase [Planctomycetota bacterium]